MAHKFYVTMEGAVQGKFKGELSEKDMPNKLAGLQFSFEMTAPYDKATGQSAGKRQMHPVSFIKERGAASAMIFHALTTNEVIKSVLFEFYHTKPDGERVVYYTVKLTNAKIVKYRMGVGLGALEGSATASHHDPDVPELEQIELVFQKIEVEHKEAKTMSQDDWPG